MGIIGADHTCYTVRDLDTARHFYCDILGFEIIHARPEITNRYFRDIIGFPDAVVRDLYLRIPGTNHHLELFEYQHPRGVQQDTTPNNPGSSHIAYLVDDLRALYKRLRTVENVEFISEPVYLDEGPNLGGWALYMKDPNGIIIELFQSAANA
jgi:catechol 2,3-dioxygenase-like lactoylglutathione lyase family enzyme